MILCVSGASIFEIASRTFPFKMPSAWMIKLLLALFPSSISPLTRKAAGSISHSTMSRVLGEVTWRALREHGLVCKEEVQRRIRGPGIGAIQWTINSVIGIGPNSPALVKISLFFLLYDNLSTFLGALLAKKYSNAVKQSATHNDEFDGLCVGIPDKTLDSWTEKITAWEFDRGEPNPYFQPSSGTSGPRTRCSWS